MKELALVLVPILMLSIFFGAMVCAEGDDPPKKGSPPDDEHRMIKYPH